MLKLIKEKKEINLLSYLPPFLREYDETKTALDAENPEFKLLWEQSARVLDESFILTANEYGIGRFEKLTGILPDPESDLEARRSAVMVKWLSKLPYTYRMLLKQLEVICGEDFSVIKRLDEEYFLRVVTHLRDFGKTAEVKRLLDEMIPANITADYYNSVTFKSEKYPFLYTGIKACGKHKKVVVNVSRF